MDMSYFNDIELHQSETMGQYTVTKDELIEFAKKWDPFPFHVDEEMAKGTQHGGLIAAGTHTIAIAVLLHNHHQPRVATIAGLEISKVLFHVPVRPDDCLTVTRTCLSKKESKSKPDRGIIRFQVDVTNQIGQLVLDYNFRVMVAKRPIQTDADNNLNCI